MEKLRIKSLRYNKLEAILPLDSFYNHLDNKLESVVRASAIDYDRMTNSFIAALSGMGMYMDNKKVGQLTSRTVENDINVRNKRLNRLGGGANIV